MAELPLVLSIMISLSEELEDRLADAEARLQALRADVAAVDDSKARTAAHLGALYQELMARAVGLGVLRDEAEATGDEPSTVVEKIRMVFSDDGRVATSEVITLESWRRSQAVKRLVESSPQQDAQRAEKTDEATDTRTPETLEQALDRVLTSLTPVEEKVIRVSYGYGQPYEDGRLTNHQRWIQRIVAKIMGLSQPEVSRIHGKALRKLKHPGRSRHLRPFAEVPRTGASRAQAIVLAVFGELEAT